MAQWRVAPKGPPTAGDPGACRKDPNCNHLNTISIAIFSNRVLTYISRMFYFQCALTFISFFKAHHNLVNE